MEKMRAKFRCVSVEDFGGSYKQAKLTTQYSDSPEDQQFNKATPSGDLTIMIDNPKAVDFLKPGKAYYLDFSEAGE